MPVAARGESGPQLVTVESLVANDDVRHFFVRQEIKHMGAFISLTGMSFILKGLPMRSVITMSLVWRPPRVLPMACAAAPPAGLEAH